MMNRGDEKRAWIDPGELPTDLSDDLIVTANLIRRVIVIINEHANELGEDHEGEIGNNIVAVALNILCRVLVLDARHWTVGLSQFNSMVVDYFRDIESNSADSIGPTKGEA